MNQSVGNMSDEIIAAGIPFSFCDFTNNPGGVSIIHYIYCILVLIIWTVLVVLGYNRMAVLNNFMRGSILRNERSQNP